MEIIDQTTVLVALGIVAGVMALYLLGAPLLVRLVFRKPIESGLTIIEPDQEVIPDEALESFRSAQGVLSAMGFEQGPHLRLDPVADLMDAYAMVMVHPANRDMVMVLHCVAPSVLMYLEFSTEFEDGTEINTNNGSQLPLGVVSKTGKAVFWFPDMDDPAELYRAHTALCSAHGTSRKKTPPQGLGIVAEIQKGIRDDFDHAVERGALRIDEISQAYAMTTLGAYRLAWPNMFPISAFCKVRRRNRDRLALKRAVGR